MMLNCKTAGLIPLALTSLIGLGLSAGAANAKIVDEGELAQYCAQEAVIKLDVDRASLMILPVERTRGIFHVYGQTDEASPTLFECQFDGKRKFLGMKVKGGHDHQDHAAKGAPKAAINKCLQMVGVPAVIETVSALRPGFHEIIIKEKATHRRVACTVPDDGSEIEDWVEMN
jgi:hypothetical protein